MANYPKKMTDPTEAALSAIQEALNIRQDEEVATGPSEPVQEPLAENMADLLSGPAHGGDYGAVREPGQDDLFGEEAIGTRDLTGQTGRAANDDQQSIGQILHALQRRPARSSYFVATAFSCAWIVGCLSLSFAYLSEINAALGPGHSSIALMVGLGAAALLPIIFFFGVAHMAWRAQELRLIAQSMARVAMRLAEPESVARDSIVTVGQAIRREVAAMGDGVERALARASELEALVQNEVAALERTYSDNEVRIRGLLQDMTSQRDTLVGQAEQVRSAISNVHVDLTQDLSTISELVGQQVNDAAQRITHSLAERGEHITLTLGQIGDTMIQQLSDRGGDLLDRLESASSETSRAIGEASQRLSASLDFKTNHVSEEFAEIATGLEDMMNSRLDRITEAFSEKSLAVVDLVAGRSQEFTDAIVETSGQIAETLAQRVDEVNSTLRSSGESLLVDLDLRGGELAAKLQQSGDRVAELLTSHSTTMTEQVRESAEQVAGAVATRNDAIKEMLAARLAAFEEMFNHTGAELGERISRDSSTLGNLITRHLAEFDRTVKTYGSELVERLGARTQDVTDSMRTYVDSFDNRVTAKANEVTTALDQRLTNFQETLDGRVADVAKTLAEGGKDVTAAVDRRIGEVTTLIDTRAAKLTDAVGERIAKIDATLGKGAMDVANTLDDRIGKLEQLLIGRAEAVVQQLELRSRGAADLLNSRMEQLSESIKTNSGNAERALSQLAVNTTEAIGKAAAASTAATEALNRSAAEATVSLNRSAGALTNTITKSATAANETLGKTTATATDLLAKTSTTVNDTVGKAAAAANDTIVKASASAAELLTKTTQSNADAIGRTVSEAERKLLGMSHEVARSLVGKANEIHGEMTQRVDDMTRLLDQNSNGLLVAMSSKGEALAGEVARITDQAVKSIDAKGYVFTQTMMEKSEDIARLINDASLNATSAITHTLGQMQEGAQGVTEAAKATITRTLEELHRATRGAIEESKQTAAATVAEMMETHTMLRSDSTALFERLREANILLQEVLSGAQENMNSIEHTMASRVSEFVAAMSDLSSKSGATTTKVEQSLGTFNNVTARVLHDLGDLADQFNSHGRTLADAVDLLDASNRKTEESIASRHSSIETLVATLDGRTEDFGERLQRFSALLDESLDTAAARAREIAGIIAESSGESVQAIEQQYDLVRKSSDEERLRTSEALNTLYDEASSEVQAMFNQSASRFTEIMQGMKQMAAEMQRELETTRTELRRGILELPQETADSTAQMRRVIVDQIEALAELNRIVARHGRSLDASEPVRREAEPVYAAGSGSGRGQVRPMRPDMAPPQQPAPRDITGAPARRSSPPNLSPVPGGKDDNAPRNGGWLSDLLSRASREETSPPIAPVPREAPREDDRAPRDNVDSIDSLSVDIARMIDNDTAAEAWDRFRRGERGVFTRRLYTQQGQKAFDEIRNKYRSDPEFRQTVEHYIHEFERLLDDVSRGDRGPAVARNYLTSDTGKVFTLLAHAAGRFE